MSGVLILAASMWTLAVMIIGRVIGKSYYAFIVPRLQMIKSSLIRLLVLSASFMPILVGGMTVSMVVTMLLFHPESDNPLIMWLINNAAERKLTDLEFWLLASPAFAWVLGLTWGGLPFNRALNEMFAKRA